MCRISDWGHFVIKSSRHFTRRAPKRGLPIFCMLVNKPEKPAQCRRADFIFQKRSPTQQQARRPEGHARPAPKREIVGVPDNFAVAKYESRFDDIMHPPPRAREGVAGLPVRPAGLFICLNISEFDAQIFARLAEIMPHGRDFFSVFQVKNRIRKSGIRVVAGGHAAVVFALETFVKVLDELLVGIHAEQLFYF